MGAIEISKDKIVSSIDKDTEIQYPYHWGAMAFQRDFLSQLNAEMPHTGYGIRECLDNNIHVDYHLTDGDYFDCGTFSEYRRYINFESFS